MELQAFGVCPTCVELYPSSRGCPECDGDEQSARLIARASRLAHAAEAPRRQAPQRTSTLGLRRAQQYALAAALGVTVVVGTLILFSA